jgi:hypothetical protein
MSTLCTQRNLARRSRRRRRAAAPRVSRSPTGVTSVPLHEADDGDLVDTAFRQQRLKAWQYV